MKTIVKKKINVNQEKAFNAFSDARLLSKWFTTNARQNFRTGGVYKNDDHDEGKFLEVIKPKKIMFTWENKIRCPGTTVTISFTKKGSDKTLITILHSDLKDKAEVSSMQTGWTRALFSLKSYLEKGKAVRYKEWEELMKKKSG